MKNEKVPEVNVREEKEDLLEVVVEDYIVSDPDYGELIIEMVHKIKNQDYLRKIYSFTKVIYNKERNEKESG